MTIKLRNKLLVTQPIDSNFGIGAPNGATVSVVEHGNGVIHQTVLTCTATPITMVDDAGVAQFGGVKVYDFPLGALLTLGCVMDGDFTAIEPWLDTWTGDTALGTAAASTGNTLVGTEADIMQSTAIGTASALVAAIDASMTLAAALTESGARWFNGTNTAIDMFLNVIADDNAGNTATTDSISFTGTVTVTWINLGTIAV